MKKPKKTFEEADVLRQKAEQLLKNKHSLKVNSTATEPWKHRNEAETVKLLHELEVHQIELEMQNQQLQFEIEKAETSAEKYANLYDFAPSGYFSLNCEGEICKLNFNGAKLLHRERSKLINTQFKQFIEPTTRRNFNDFLNRILETNTKQSCEVQLVIPKKPAAFVHVEGLFLETEEEYLLTAVDVTKRKEAEQRAKDIDTKWKTLFQDTPKLAVKGYDKNGNIIYWNKAAEAFYGYTAEEAIGSKLTDLIVPEEAKTYVNAAIAEMLRTKIPTPSSEAKYKCKNGATREVFSSHTHVQNPDGEPEMYCIDIDLTEHKLVEEKYRVLIEDSPVGVYQTDAQGKCIFTNRIWRKMSGLTEEEAKGDGWIKALHEEDTDRIFQNWQKMVASNGRWGHEYRIKDRDGNVSWVFGTASTMYNEANEIIGYVGTNTDITKLKQTEKALKDSDARWRTFLQDIPNVAVQGYDINGKTIYWNKASELFYGYAAKEAIGIPLVELVFPKESRSNFIHDFKQMFATKTPIPPGELNLKCKDGSPINVFSSHAYVKTPGCEPEMFCIDIDISERKKAEAELIKAKEKAEESDRLKSAFLANMSHEIRTPMNGILGFADLLKEPNLTGAQQQDYIKIIEQSGTRMLNTINSIMSISKIESGVVELRKTQVNVNETINYMYTFFKPEVEAKGIEFSFKNALTPKASVIHTDKEKLIAVLTNLIKNSIKFTQKGSITFGYIQTGENLEFYVKDTGIGIAYDRQEVIFDRFIQADIQDKFAFQGAGLGLSISKAFVEMLGGKLWMKSIKGQGSTFYFSVPYSPIIT